MVLGGGVLSQALPLFLSLPLRCHEASSFPSPASTAMMFCSPQAHGNEGVYFYMLFVLFSLTAFNILSLISLLGVLMIICCGEFLFWSSPFGVLFWLPVLEWAILSQGLGNFLLLFY
jgi:hypothetical protein